MYEGVPADQFHQFIASTTTTLPLPLSSPSLHGSSSSSPTVSSFDLYTCHPQVPLQPNFLHPLHQTSQSTAKSEYKQVGMSLEIQKQRSIPELMDPWSCDEVLTLLRIRSSLENWLPEFTWDHVSRKLAELGFKRSAEKCKEKFEEESRYLNNINFSKNYRVFSEFEDLYNGDNHNQNPQEIVAEKSKDVDKASQDEDKVIIEQHGEQEDSRIDQTPVVEKNVEKLKTKKRKREKKFEMFKGFCEDIISKITAQQEEMHNKLLEDMVKRDEEKVAREEAWKKQEMDRIDKELQIRAQEQALAGDRQATIINFLKKFSSSSSVSCIEIPGDKASNPSTSQNPNPAYQTNNQTKPIDIVAIDHQDSNFSAAKNNPVVPTSMEEPQNPSSLLAPQNPNKILNSQINQLSTDAVQKKHVASNDKDDLGKRWPKDEVLALINLRCSLYNNNEDKESATVKAPLWERISKGMLDLGYKRSAKRCKEKWENINKYFRKTRDVSKKRSADSRTCPYFHQLNTLYSQGKLVASSDGLEKQPVSPENCPDNPTIQVAEGEKNLVQASGFEFGF